jgi:hypothetical protein
MSLMERISIPGELVLGDALGFMAEVAFLCYLPLSTAVIHRFSGNGTLKKVPLTAVIKRRLLALSAFGL